LGFAQSNYSGIQGVFVNPAHLADSRNKLFIQLASFDLQAANNVANVRTPYKQMLALKNKVPDFYLDENGLPFFEDDYIEENLNGNRKYAFAAFEVAGPSVAFNLKDRSGFAFYNRTRSFVHLSGLNESLLKVFMEDMAKSAPDYDIKQHQRRLLDQPFTQEKMSATVLAYEEVGFSYARVLSEERENFWKAGITVKFLTGLGAANISVDRLNYQLTGIDTLQLDGFDMNYSYISEDFYTRDDMRLHNYFGKSRLGRGMGIDLGVVYEYRPNFREMYYRMDRKKHEDKTINKYKLRVAASIADIGGINFKNDQYAHHTSISSDSLVQWNNFVDFDYPQSSSKLDSTAFAYFDGVDTSRGFKMKTPTSLNLQIDVALGSKWFWGTSYIQNLRSLNVQGARKQSLLLTGIRYEHRWFEFGTSFQFGRMYTPMQLGMYTRLGPVYIGADNLGGLLGTKSTNSYNLYAGVKLSIPHKHLADRDFDGTSDEKDKCPDLAGSEYAFGCPDEDNDEVPDKDDLCPDVPGDKKLKGCPDPDGDGIVGEEDLCPDIYGNRFNKGCPDTDGDGVLDKDDRCKYEKGSAANFGCPELIALKDSVKGDMVVVEKLVEETVFYDDEEMHEDTEKAPRIPDIKETPKEPTIVRKNESQTPTTEKPKAVDIDSDDPIATMEFERYDYYVVLGVYKNKSLADALSRRLYDQAGVLTYIFLDETNGLNYVTFGRADSEERARNFAKNLDVPEVNKAINGKVWWKKIPK
jgi:hypothetical protein